MSAPNFEPFPLMDFQIGLYEAKESWIAPPNAFTKIENARIWRGQLLKRPGYRRFGKLGNRVFLTPQVLDAGAPGPPYDNPTLATLTNAPVLHRERLPSLYKVRIYEDGAPNQEVFDQPVDQADHTSITGILHTAITGEVVPAVPSLLDRQKQLANPPLLGYYEATLLGSTHAFPPSELIARLNTDRTHGRQPFNILVRDPSRLLPVPATPMITLSWTLPAGGGSVSIPFGTPFPRTVGAVDDNIINADGSCQYFFPTHPHFDLSTAGPWVQSGGIAAPLKHVNAEWLADPGVVTVDYIASVGEIDYLTGDVDVDWPITPVADVKATYEWDPAEPVMGIYNFFIQQGNEYLVALNTKRMWNWNKAEVRFYEVDEVMASPFTGDDDDYFTFAAFEDKLVMANGKDQVHKYEPLAGPPPTIGKIGSNFDADVSTGEMTTGNDIDYAHMVFRHKGRVVYLSTKEQGTEWKQRARWTPINDIEYTNAIGEEAEYFADAPTDDIFVTAGFVGDQLICAFSREFWRLRYTGDSPEGAFIWEKLPSAEGAQGRMSVARLSEEIVMRGEKSIISCDGVSERPVDQQIPDFTVGWNKDASSYSFSHYSKELRQWLMTFADKGEAVPGSVFATQIDEERRTKTFSIYRLPFHCFGAYRQTQSRTMNTTSQAMNQITYSMNSSVDQQGFPLVLAGDRLGNIWEFGNVFADDGAEVAMEVDFIRINPYPWERVHLGWIDVICKAFSGETLELRVREDYSTTPYYAQALSIAAGSVSSEKVKIRYLINRVANFHTIELRATSSKALEIDAVTPWFLPAGRMRNIT